ncbi:MAG: glycosyltransferase family 4 protein [Planctomycetota bacterium]
MKAPSTSIEIRLRPAAPETLGPNGAAWPDVTTPVHGDRAPERLDARVVFLTHYIPLYQVRVLQEISRRIRDFRVLLSTAIEPNRDFELDWSDLDVTVQKNWTLRWRWKHATAGFKDPLFVQVPLDTGRKLRKYSPDVVVSHELGVRSLAAARYCRRHGRKLVLATFMSEHTEQGRGRARIWLRKRLIAAADAITYNGPSCRDYLLSSGARPETLFEMPYAADDRTRIDVQPRVDESVTRHRLLCIGQLTERKGVLPLIRDANRFCMDRGRPLELTFVGDGPLRPSVQALAAGETIHSSDPPLDPRLRLRLLGNQPASTLPHLMQEHGVVIAPTLADEWLMVVNEAMHAGMPVIGSIYAQAVATLIQDGRNGWQYDPLQPGSLATVLDRYWGTSDRELAQMRCDAISDASSITPGASADGLLAAIQSVDPRFRSTQ